MTAERFQQIERLFEQAAGLLRQDRAPFLERQCGDDIAMREEVESLLEADEAAGSRIAEALENAAAALPAAAADAGEVGKRFGPYLLRREVGRGGMGAVYEAIRSDGEYQQTVAVKLIKRGMDTDAIVRRFRAERQILAGLSHPNIASLLDGGTSEDGRPYLVVEFIDGQPLLDYARARRMSARERLQLFRPICRAVDHAHRRGILHRDIKPANVMVNVDGVPKLLDFGIAKLLVAETAGSPPTEADARIMTPHYASPEHVRGEVLTPASDVYSLGILLRQLLTGTELTRLPRDLDAIIGMATREEPERRYGSPAELEADVAQFLAGFAVRARPDSSWYRARKWTRRHALVAAPSVGLALLASAAGAYWWWERRSAVPEEVLELCRQAEQLLRADVRASQPGQGLPGPLRESIALWERATRLAPRHEPAWTGLAAAAEFAIDYDAGRARELSQAAEHAAGRALELQPQSAAAFAVRGALRFREWKFTAAAEEYERSLAINRSQPYVLADLAGCLNLTGRNLQAIAKLEDGLHDEKVAKGTHGPNVRAMVVLLGAAAEHHRMAGNLDLARQRAERAIELQGNYAPARLQLGRVLEQAGDWKAAEREFHAAFLMRPADQRAAAALGHLYGRQGRRRDAQEMISALRKLAAEGIAVNGSFALVHAGLGEHEAAIQALEQAAAAREAGLPYRLVDYRLKHVLCSPRAAAIAEALGLRQIASTARR